MAKKLEEYEKKRDFDKTAEPKAQTRPSGPALRFVVQRHDASRLHYDFRLEYDGVLLSWAVPKGPSRNPRDKRLAVRVEDHPIDYRHFEGTIPQDEYGGGTVQLFDEGIWTPKSDPGEALKKGTLKFSLEGERLRGGWSLIRLRPKEGEDGDNWLLIKEKDEFALEEDGVTSIETSVRTGRTLEEITEEGSPEGISEDDKTASPDKEPPPERVEDEAGKGPSGKEDTDARMEEGIFLIGGWTVSNRSRTGLTALMLGRTDSGRLLYEGRAGAGFTKEAVQELLGLFKHRQRKTPPLINPPPESSEEKLTWLRADLAVKVRYETQPDSGGKTRMVYLGLAKAEEPSQNEKKSASPPDREKRDGKKSKNAIPQDDELQYGLQKLTSPGRLVFPEDGVTKKDVADYYWAMREMMLPYLIGRPLTFIRCTDQIGEDCFFQKHESLPIPGVRSETLFGSSGQEGEVMTIEGEDGLMGAVQMGAVEFHSWGAEADAPDKADWLVFDLDPDEKMPADEIRRGVRDLKSLLDENKLHSFLKTSGGKGYHIVIPLSPAVNWDQARGFAKDLALRMEEKWPERYTANMRKDERVGRIYVDWVRNGRGATSVSVFSLRARPGAPVSWPLRWEDLDEIEPNEITLKNLEVYRFALEGWTGFFKVRQGLMSLEDK